MATLHGCLRHLVAPERLGVALGASDSGGWVCGSCQRRQAAVKQLSIRRLPPVLALHVKRFEHRHHGHHHAHGGHAGAAGAGNGLGGMEAGGHAGGGRSGRPHGGGRHHAPRKVQVRLWGSYAVPHPHKQRAVHGIPGGSAEQQGPGRACTTAR